MEVEETFPHALFHVAGVGVRDTVVVTWVIMAILAGVSWLATRRLRDRPGPIQNAAESVVEGMESLVRGTTSFAPHHFLPLIGTLGIFLFVANTASVIPQVGSPTRDLSTAAALAAIVFVSVHYYGIRFVGLSYLRGYVWPSWILLPFNIIGEVTRTVALAVRLFGNMLSGELIVAVLLLIAALVVPVAMQLLGLLLGIIQAYVFTLLAMVYIASGLRPGEQEQTTGESTT